MEGEQMEEPLVAGVPDSADARLFVELTSHATDLSAAHEAIGLAIRASDSRSHEEVFFAGYAAMAYCRAMMPSKVRQPLGAHLDVPEALQPVHEQVRAYRNRTVSHSQSELDTSIAFAVLDPSTIDVVWVGGATVSPPLPRHILVAFEQLFTTMAAMLEQVIDEVRVRLTAEINATDAAARRSVTTPRVVSAWAADFSAKSTRRPYPSTLTLYMEAEKS